MAGKRGRAIEWPFIMWNLSKVPSRLPPVSLVEYIPVFFFSKRSHFNIWEIYNFDVLKKYETFFFFRETPDFSHSEVNFLKIFERFVVSDLAQDSKFQSTC